MRQVYAMLKKVRGQSILRILSAFLLLVCAAPGIRAQGDPNAAQQNAPANFETLAKSAAAAREAGKSEEAIRDYQRAVDLRPDWEEGWWYLGTMRYDADQFAAAIPAFQKIVQLDPRLGPAWNLLGLCEFEVKDFANARAHLQKGQELGGGDDPEIARVSTYHLALLLIRGAEFERASSLLATAFATAQMPEQIRYALGLALLRVPLLPQEIGPSQDALIHAAGEAAAVWAQDGPAKSLDSFRVALKKFPGAPYLHYAYGLALSAAKRDTEALVALGEEATISPQSALPQIEISRIELSLQNPQNALIAAEKAVRLAPASLAAHHVLSQSLQALGKNQQAAQESKVAESLAPEKPQPDSKITALYENHSALVPEDASWSQTMNYFSMAQYPQAIAALRTWVERKPNDGTAWAVLGLCEFEMKDYDNALIHLQRGQALGFGGSAESVRQAKYRLGILLDRNTQYAEAMELLAPEASKGPLEKEIEFVLGMALLRMARLPQDVEPAQKPLVQSAGEIAVLLETSKYDQAFPKFQALLREFPDAPFLHYAYGIALASLSQYAEAEMQMREEIRISPASELPFVRLATISLKQHRAADALSPAERAVKLAPDSAEAHYILGRTHLELGEDQPAIRELEIAGKDCARQSTNPFQSGQGVCQSEASGESRTGTLHFCAVECLGRGATQLAWKPELRRAARFE